MSSWIGTLIAYNTIEKEDILSAIIMYGIVCLIAKLIKKKISNPTID